jgi:cardiolipin-specific phospholipase
MVMLHGFGGGAATFMQMAPMLQPYFNVYCVDLLGMGASGRPPFTAKTIAQTISFFTSSLQSLFT